MRRFSRTKTYTREEMTRAADAARESFREERIASERYWASLYRDEFELACHQVEQVFEITNNLSDLEGHAVDLLGGGYLDTLRYMTCPVVSADDFKSVSGVGTTARNRLADPDLARDAMSYLSRNLNECLFPWMHEGIEPTQVDLEAAKRTIAALVAEQKIKTLMRNRPSRDQEEAVRSALIKQARFKMVSAHPIDIVSDAPQPGQVFDKETSVGGVRADIVLGLHDGRFMALECKVSNSGVNSYKRLNHEVTDKVEKWSAMFGNNGVVGGCVLQGIFEVDNLMSAQQSGVSIFWSRDLGALVSYVESTRMELDGS